MALLACRLWLREGGREAPPPPPPPLPTSLPRGPGNAAVGKGKRKDSPSVKASVFVAFTPICNALGESDSDAAVPASLSFPLDGVCPVVQLRGPSPSPSGVTLAFPT